MSPSQPARLLPCPRGSVVRGGAASCGGPVVARGARAGRRSCRALGAVAPVARDAAVLARCSRRAGGRRARRRARCSTVDAPTGHRSPRTEDPSTRPLGDRGAGGGARRAGRCCAIGDRSRAFRGARSCRWPVRFAEQQRRSGRPGSSHARAVPWSSPTGRVDVGARGTGRRSVRRARDRTGRQRARRERGDPPHRRHVVAGDVTRPDDHVDTTSRPRPSATAIWAGSNVR